jgi:O-antigen ligase
VSRTRLQTPLELAIGVLAAAFTVANVLHAGSVAAFAGPAREGRFALLALLGVCAISYVALVRPELRLAYGPVVAAGALALLALASPAWSVAPHRSLEQAAAFAMLLACAILIAAAGESAARSALVGAAAGATIVALGGLVLYLVRKDLATFTFDNPQQQHYRGLGQNANTVSLLAAVTIAPAVWQAVASRQATARALGGLATVALGATTVASGSRGAQAAAAAALLVTGATLPVSARRRAIIVVAAVVLLAAGALQAGEAFGASRLPAQPPSLPPGSPGALANELGGSSVIGFSSGRTEAWRGAVEQAWQRPHVGFGFATENPVFIDRYAQFQGAYVENSYIGLLLQLGVTGVVLLVAAVGLALVGCARAVARRPRTGLHAACAGSAAAGVLLAIVQSYVTAPGNVATLAVWLALLVPACAVGVRLRARSLTLAAVAALALALVAIPVGRAQAQHHLDEQQAGMRAVYAATGRRLVSPRLTTWRLMYLFDCFGYRSEGNPYALETCWDSQGRLVEAVDRRGREPRFFTVRYEPDEAPVRIDPRRVRRALAATGAFVYAAAYLGGYPLHSLPVVDSGPRLVRVWLRLVGSPLPPAMRGSG